MYTYQIYIFLLTHTILLSNMINYKIYIYTFINFNQFRPTTIKIYVDISNISIKLKY